MRSILVQCPRGNGDLQWNWPVLESEVMDAAIERRRGDAKSFNVSLIPSNFC